MTDTPFVNRYVLFCSECTVLFLHVPVRFRTWGSKRPMLYRFLALRCADPHPLTMWVSHTIAAWSVGLRQISFGLLEPPSCTGSTRRLEIPLRPPLRLPKELRGRISEAMNPVNEGIEVLCVLLRPVAL